MPFQMRTWFSQPSNFSGANVMHFYWAKTVAQVLLRAKKMPVLSIALSSLTIMWTWWFGASVAFSANDPRRLCLCVSVQFYSNKLFVMYPILLKTSSLYNVTMGENWRLKKRPTWSITTGKKWKKWKKYSPQEKRNCHPKRGCTKKFGVTNSH